ncbi:Uncharacterized protein NF27_EY00290 [Candidatus Jidaibacter acanthamoeba]|uniref:Ferritin/DPS domain-containing protein n=1 Tax=Candidatus Jidaibacter acanthamoebae TaxID=86105 RepID=A0A0C1QLE9_9RICK|nr:DNA starvation/stationary phase protection protein [Candidatus Jidaibacter acanthamoeba]KIE04933.1 Uncharacterized protein NF27_EY00290 [Candidatus Jidaibacter acanthamoeba]
MTKVINQLKVVLADTYSLYLKTQNYHWNVVGEHFNSLHKMLEEQYEKLAEMVDETAEKIRMLGEKAPGTFSEFSALSSTKNPNSEYPWRKMVEDLLNDHKNMCINIEKFIKICEEEQDYTTNDMLTQRLAFHQKICWMLKSLIAG